jgi:hypothetical protein
MGEGLRRPIGPLQVKCVLAAAVLAVAFSFSPIRAQPAGRLPMPDKPNLGSLGERINANTIAIVSGNLNASDLTVVGADCGITSIEQLRS